MKPKLMKPKFKIGQVVELRREYVRYRNDIFDEISNPVRGMILSSSPVSMHVMDRPVKIVDTTRYLLLVNGKDISCDEEDIQGGLEC